MVATANKLRSSTSPRLIHEGIADAKTHLHTARHDLLMSTGGGLNAAYNTGAAFDYFDTLRQLLERASSDILFIDQYMGADFVSRYLPYVRAGVRIRLLTGTHELQKLLVAVDVLCEQTAGANQISVRTEKFHDRYVIIDHKMCLQSGASFKDGARKDPTTLTEQVDLLPAVLEMYEGKWASGTQHR